jgi:putative toxin-antitoxin system antitoxin component (TIGR02293 family)
MGESKASEPGSSFGNLSAVFAASAPFSRLYRLEPLETVALVKKGVPARFLVRLIRDMASPKNYVVLTIGIAPSTATRKMEADGTLNLDESERVLGLGKLIGQVQSIVEESGEPAGFDAAKWVAEWIKTPQRALGGKRPDELLDTSDGRQLVSDLIGRQQSGAYS